MQWFPLYGGTPMGSSNQGDAFEFPVDIRNLFFFLEHVTSLWATSLCVPQHIRCMGKQTHIHTHAVRQMCFETTAQQSNLLIIYLN